MHSSSFALWLLPLFALPSLASRTITVNNKCSSPLYIAVAGQGGSITKVGGGSQPAGWLQKPGEFSFGVPEGWHDARVWARTGCEETGNSLKCVIGGCPGEDTVECSGTKFGTAGATLAEFTLDRNNMDAYDVSIVDGYNLPMEITASDTKCPKGSCGVETDILGACDPSLVFPQNKDKIYSCNSACGNLVQFQHGSSTDLMSADPNDSPVCCRKGSVTVPHTDCPNTYIPFYKVMKQMCRDAYVYSDDDMYQDAVFACSNSGKPTYTVTFCPNGDGLGLNPPPISKAVKLDREPGDNKGNLQKGPDQVALWAGVKGTPIGNTGGESKKATQVPTVVNSDEHQTTKSTNTQSTPTGNVNAVVVTSTVTQKDDSTKSYTSGSNVYVEVTVVETVTVKRDIQDRRLGCLRGKRWVGKREMDC
ncbi:uncharacterized protein L203_103205 [Cryptococcus depauperatus CBS 7841]|uniref:Thaumatin family protein n=1 Tax=Cryptococcus depauperatus CBS 7841 TaxID=1295531 RepID=A0AAJ8M1V5_9TREE